MVDSILEIDKLIKELENEERSLQLLEIPDFCGYYSGDFETRMKDPYVLEHIKRQQDKQSQIRLTILELRKKRAVLLDSNSFTPNNAEEKIDKDIDQNKEDYSNTTIRINQKDQTIFVGERKLSQFNDLFELLKINEKETNRESQIKGGIVLICAIGRYMELKNNEHMLISDLLGYCHEFKEKWNNWKFKKKGARKKSISKTDCESANTILLKCNLSMRFKLSPDKKEILISGGLIKK